MQKAMRHENLIGRVDYGRIDQASLNAQDVVDRRTEHDHHGRRQGPRDEPRSSPLHPVEPQHQQHPQRTPKEEDNYQSHLHEHEAK